MQPIDFILRTLAESADHESAAAARAWVEARRWIPIAEREPPIGEFVIVSGEWGPDFGRRPDYMPDTFITGDGAQISGVTHWMMQPEPPEGEG